MGALFSKGETKERPGLYRRYENRGKTTVVGAIDGIGAITVQADFGPLGEVTKHENIDSIKTMYGEGGTVPAAIRMFNAGLSELYIYRVGTGGTAGSVSLDGASGAACTLTLKYPGKKAFSVTVREKLGDSEAKELIVYEDKKTAETITFSTGDTEVQNLVDAVNSKSAYFTATKTAEGTLKAVSQKEVTAGTNPTVSNSDYDTAFTALEPFSFNVITVDTNTHAVHLVLHEFVKRMYNTGKLPMGVVGEPTSVEFDTRCTNSAAYNNNFFVYCGGSYKDSDGYTVEGYEAAAIVAGIVASTPSNQSVVHALLSDAVETAEKLTDSQYITAIKNGMILFSDNGNGGVWLDSGVTTLVNLSAEQDEGWKKIKRTKVRIELFDRMDRTIAPLIGKINCDSDGVTNVIKLGRDVIDAMIAEKKLLSGGTITEDTDRPHEGDSAWFLIDVDDIDTLEKIYMAYRFRFSENA